MFEIPGVSSIKPLKYVQCCFKEVETLQTDVVVRAKLWYFHDTTLLVVKSKSSYLCLSIKMTEVFCFRLLASEAMSA